MLGGDGFAEGEEGAAAGAGEHDVAEAPRPGGRRLGEGEAGGVDPLDEGVEALQGEVAGDALGEGRVDPTSTRPIRAAPAATMANIGGSPMTTSVSRPATSLRNASAAGRSATSMVGRASRYSGRSAGSVEVMPAVLPVAATGALA